jgi:hypothetical protein
LGDAKPTFFESYGNDVEFSCLEKGVSERFLCLINWTDRSVEVDAGVMLPQGTYRILQRTLTSCSRAALNGHDAFNAGKLGRFRVRLEPWDVRILYVHPDTGPVDEGMAARNPAQRSKP